MTKFAMAGTVLLALAAPMPALAQAAVSEPGMVQFYHPDADVLHAGPGAYGYSASPPYEAHAYVGGPVLHWAYPHRRSSRALHPRSRLE
jgi:hypothetical protein